MCLFHYMGGFAMSEMFNYNSLLNQALIRIRDKRDPRSVRQEYIGLNQQSIFSERIVSIGGNEYDFCSNTLDAARKISVDCVKAILFYLFQHYQIDVDIADTSTLEPNIQFAFVNKKEASLLVFLTPEKDLSWRLEGYEPDNLTALKRKYGVNICKYVYLMYDKAINQFFGYSMPEAETSNILTIKDLFCQYFCVSEYEAFRRHFSNYTAYINNYLGFAVVKNLTPVAQVNFRSAVLHRILSFDYSKLLTTKMHDKILITSEYSNLRQHFIDEGMYLALFGSSDFAESLITAEWMYDSMREAQAIDLTVIGMGYLKSIEQLLYSIILLHKNEGRTIKSCIKDGPFYIQLDDTSIADKSIDSTIGSLANFCAYRSNQDIFRNTLHFKTKKYVTEAIFVFKDIRNGYFHKHNIKDWAKIDEIRDITYKLAFLLLGAAEIAEGNKHELGFPKGDFTSDRYKLCEYVNYHAGDLFFLVFSDGNEAMVQAVRDPKSALAGNAFMNFSGAYFSQHGHPAVNVFSDMPDEIHLGTLGVDASAKDVRFNPKKVQLIYSHGKFVGPSIFDEIGTHY